MLYQLSYSCMWARGVRARVGVIGFEPIQPKHWIYSPARLSNCGAPPKNFAHRGPEPMDGLEPPTS